jgi:hypothetical protein
MKLRGYIRECEIPSARFDMAATGLRIKMSERSIYGQTI